MPFRQAYKIVGELVAVCIELGTTFEKLPLEEYRKVSDIFDENVYEAVDLINAANGRNVIGGPAESAVLNQIAHLKANLGI